MAEAIAEGGEEERLIVFGEYPSLPEDRDGVVERARDLMDRITQARENVSARMLNELASIMEDEEARYQQRCGYPHNVNSRSSHLIGRLLTLIRDHDEFYEMISSHFILEGSMATRAAGARLLLSCVVCWTTFNFDEPVVAMLKRHMLEEFDSEIPKCSSKSDKGKTKDAEMLHTYIVGLYAQALGGPELVEDSLTGGLPRKLTRYLRLRVLGDVDNQQHGDGKQSGHKSRDESRARFKQALELVDLGRTNTDANGDVEEPVSISHEPSSAEGDDRRKKKDRATRTSTAVDEVGTSRKKAESRDKSGGRHRGKARSSDVNDPPRSKHISAEAETEEPNAVYLAGNVDISVSTRKAVAAARKEARGANASQEAVVAAGDAAAEMVKCAALEAQGGDEVNQEAVLAAAEAAAETVIAAAASISRKEAERLEKIENPMGDPVREEAEADEYAVSPEALAFLKARFCVQCLDRLGEYLEVLLPIVQERGVDVCVALLRRHSQHTSSSSDMNMVSDVLKLICALAAHRKFAALLVDRRGIQQLLSTPRVPETYVGISLCLFAVASLQSVMERVCAITPSVVPDMVTLAFQLLECPQDSARKNASLFFGATFVFRPVIDSFDSQDGLRRLLNLLRNAVSLRSGGSVSRGGSTGSRSGNSNSPPYNLSQLLRFGHGPAEVLTSAEKQIAYHACVALRQYFRAHFLLLVESLRPCKGHRGGLRSSNLKNPYKPIDVSNEAVEALIQQLCRDRRLAATFVKTKWSALENFMNYDGHLIMLEFSQAAPGEKYLHDMVPHALAVLQIVTLVPSARRAVVSSAISNERPGMAVILDAVSGTASFEPEVIQLALLVLSNLVCPPPAFSSRSVQATAGTSNGAASNGHGHLSVESKANDPIPTPLVGDSRISLGPGFGGPGLAAYMEHGYRAAREAVRANNGIKVLLHLLHPKTVLAPSADDCIRALACRVLVGLARDETIAQILTKLQVGKVLSEVLRDGSQAGRQSGGGGDQDRWQAELNQVALDLMGVVTNAGRANTVASEAAAPTLRRIERATIAAATPINYHSSELLQLIHEHLLSTGLVNTASTLLKEAQISPLPPTQSTDDDQEKKTEAQNSEIHWPASVVVGPQKPEDKDRMAVDGSLRKRGFTKPLVTPKKVSKDISDSSTTPAPKLNDNEDGMPKPSTSTRTVLPAKRKANEKDTFPLTPSNKRVHLSEGAGTSFITPQARFKTGLAAIDAGQEGKATGPENLEAAISGDTSVTTPYSCYQNMLLMEPKNKNERATLDGLVVQYLKHQHRQCPAPITTLPELSLLHPHICPEPSRRLYAPYNATARLLSREILPQHGGLHGRRHNIHLIYSKFRPTRTFRDESALFTCGTFLGQSTSMALGSHSGHIFVFDGHSGELSRGQSPHSSMVASLQASPLQLPGGLEADLSSAKLLLSSASYDVRLWNSSLLSGPVHVFENRRGARFNHSGALFGCLHTESPPKEVQLYDVNTCTLRTTLADSSIIGSKQSIVHFSPSDEMVLWSGVLWDHRVPRHIHRFDQFTDYGGGGFHPAGNEVIINSEVWDLRTFKLLRSVPSLDQTVVTFNASGEVIYATLRRNPDDLSSALNGRRARNPLFSAFRTMDAVDYSDIATTQLDRCVLDLAVEPTDSFISVVAMEAHDAMDTMVRIYEVGRRRPTDDDSDPDDFADEEDDEEEEDDDENEIEVDGEGELRIGPDLNLDIDLMSNDDDDEDDSSSDDGSSSDDDDDDEGDGDEDDGDGGGGGFGIMSGSDIDDSGLDEADFDVLLQRVL